MWQSLTVVALSQRPGRRGGGHVVHLSHVQLYGSFVVSAKVETSFSHVGTISNEAPRKSGKCSWIP